nr:hypothetical protein CFP56_66836 [Quercus suber]
MVNDLGRSMLRWPSAGELRATSSRQQKNEMECIKRNSSSEEGLPQPDADVPRDFLYAGSKKRGKKHTSALQRWRPPSWSVSGPGLPAVLFSRSLILRGFDNGDGGGGWNSGLSRSRRLEVHEPRNQQCPLTKSTTVRRTGGRLMEFNASGDPSDGTVVQHPPFQDAVSLQCSAFTGRQHQTRLGQCRRRDHITLRHLLHDPAEHGTEPILQARRSLGQVVTLWVDHPRPQIVDAQGGELLLQVQEPSLGRTLDATEHHPRLALAHIGAVATDVHEDHLRVVLRGRHAGESLRRRDGEVDGDVAVSFLRHAAAAGPQRPDACRSAPQLRQRRFWGDRLAREDGNSRDGGRGEGVSKDCSACGPCCPSEDDVSHGPERSRRRVDREQDFLCLRTGGFYLRWDCSRVENEPTIPAYLYTIESVAAAVCLRGRSLCRHSRLVRLE